MGVPAEVVPSAPVGEQKAPECTPWTGAGVLGCGAGAGPRSGGGVDADGGGDVAGCDGAGGLYSGKPPSGGTEAVGTGVEGQPVSTLAMAVLSAAVTDRWYLALTAVCRATY